MVLEVVTNHTLNSNIKLVNKLEVIQSLFCPQTDSAQLK